VSDMIYGRIWQIASAAWIAWAAYLMIHHEDWAFAATNAGITGLWSIAAFVAANKRVGGHQ
jgi:hypothetical protein